MIKKKCIIMFSGGLDSKLTVKIMQEQGFKIMVVFFKLPFIKNIESEVKEFAKKNKIKLKIFDCTKGKLLQKYLKVIKEAKYGRGAGVNPCIDCKIFIMKKTKEFADKKRINLIATGEVLGQRPMSQTKRAIEIIENKSGLKKRIIRPLSDFGVLGRKRNKQIALAKKFGISYPHPAGGCLLCEKELKNRLKYLLNRGLNKHEIKLINIGRHFLIDNIWIVLGRNEKENKIIKAVGKKVGELIEPEFIGPTALIFGKYNIKIKNKVNELIKAYSNPRKSKIFWTTKSNCTFAQTRAKDFVGKGSLKERKKFEKWKL